MDLTKNINKVLLLDQRLGYLGPVKRWLTDSRYTVQLLTAKSDLFQAIRKKEGHVIVGEIANRKGGVELVEKIQDIDSTSKVIVVSPIASAKLAVDLMKRGAHDYFVKGDQLGKFSTSIEEAVTSEELPQKETNQTGGSVIERDLAQEEKKYVVGPSKQSQSVQKSVQLIAPTEMSVIISGETGTGKEYVARRILKESNRSSKPFVALDAGALSNDLAGSEFFGHVKGAFTGATFNKMGAFERANGGTLFLDEVANLSLRNQMQLLRVLQENQVKRIGGTDLIPIDVRLLVATNVSLREAMVRGDFREDIFYRLNEFNIKISPLRERIEDIEVFADHFRRLSNMKLDKHVTGITSEANTALREYGWPGNIRQLRNVVRRAVLITDDHLIKMIDLPDEVAPGHKVTDPCDVQVRDDLSLAEISGRAQRKAILRALQAADNSRSDAAKLLQINRKTLYNKMVSLDIE